MCEVRNATGSTTAQYFAYGQTISGTSYYSTSDHLGSVRELTDSSGNIQAQYTYDPFGQSTKTQGAVASDIQYSGYYFHAPSKLYLTLYRAYNANLARWMNRDPIEESNGANLYEYVDNDPLDYLDQFGLAKQRRKRRKPLCPIPPAPPILYGPPAPGIPLKPRDPPKNYKPPKLPSVPPPPKPKPYVPDPPTPPGTHYGPPYVPPSPPADTAPPFIGPIKPPPDGTVPSPPPIPPGASPPPDNGGQLS